MPADPNTLDLLTFNEGLDTLGLATTDPVDAQTQSRIETLITAVSHMIDYDSGPMVERSFSSESHDGGDYLIQLNYWPVVSISTVVEYSGTVATVLNARDYNNPTATEYILRPDGRTVVRSSNSRVVLFTRGDVYASYTAGRFTDTASVERDVKEAARIVLRHVYHGEYGSGTDMYGDPSLPPGYAIPTRAKEHLARYRQTPSLLVG